MPITPLQRQRLEQALDDHEAVLNAADRPRSSTSARVHQLLVELGRDERVLALIDDFVDVPTVAEELRSDPSAALRTRGIELPNGVAVHVLDGYASEVRPVLRFEIKVRNATVLADWEADVGACVRLARIPH
jgi:hypothetical protein